MNIRSITCFANVEQNHRLEGSIEQAGQLARRASAALMGAGFGVQTKRLATQPLSAFEQTPIAAANRLWPLCAHAGFDYLSLGPVLADGAGANLDLLDAIPEMIRATDTVFAGVLAARTGAGIHLEAIRRTARVVREIAHTTEQGFGNLRLALLANVGPHAPYFPAAYHDGGQPAIAIATESAGLAVEAFSRARSIREATDRLVHKVEEAAEAITAAIRPLAESVGYRFMGIDFSYAPFPEEALSIAAAIEGLGVDRFGSPGTLFVASLLTNCLRRAEYRRCGFNGLMLPVLEDAVLAARSRENLFTVNELLLYSAVCGTGLDTIPLPGDVSEEEVAGILLDVAALSVRLDKPLTARLMPVPGSVAGDLTEFDFDYFANGRILDVKGSGSGGLFQKEQWLAM
jgi:uncharacterized protein (UPF0210 family)